MSLIDYARSHPLLVGGGVLAGVAVFFMLNSGGGGGDNSAGLSAFYAAQAAQKTSGDQVAIAQIQANASTATAQGYFATQKDVNATWAQTQYNTTLANNSSALALATTNNATAIALAPYKVQDDYLAAITTVAAIPQQTVTSTKKSSGFFGIGGSKKTTTTVVANPAWDALAGLAGFFTAPVPGG